MADTAEGLTVIFPVATAAAVTASLGPWLAALDRTNRPYEVFVVSDDELPAPANPRVRALKLDRPGGFGAGVRLALTHATQPLVFYSALDGGYNPADLPRMIQAIDFKDEYTGKTVELVNGHRRGLAEPAGRRRRRKVFNAFVRVVYGMWPEPPKGYLGPAETRYWYRTRLQFGLRLGDPNSRFKLFRRHVFDRIVIQSDGEFVHTELLAKANFLGTLMDEMVLADTCVPGDLHEMSADRAVVFKSPRFHSPVPTPGSDTDVPPSEAPLPAA